MKEKVLGTSMHVSGDTLHYYVHFNLKGTKQVSKKEFESACNQLEGWRKDQVIKKREYEVNL